MFAFSRENRVPSIQFSKNTPKAPHIDRIGIPDPEDNLRSPIEPALDISIQLFIHKSAASEVNDLQARFILFLEYNIFWFQITVYNILSLDVIQSV